MKLCDTLSATLTAGILAVSSSMALADAGHGNAAAFGRPGEDHHVSRTIELRMGEMYFEPSRIEVKPGETIRFVVINGGQAVHEFNIGTPETWDSHQAEMARMVDEGMIDFDRIDHVRMRRMGMMHADPNAVLLEPGERAEIIWEFPGEATQVGFACNVPGHRETGMAGQISFRAEG
ncbi:MAG: hypothetical protein KatS3mg118_1273 [Paracoccaceae bacterium]|nr:MAG: hypothetical protein KatS3mg118_1273 [Paracoccaceae bacterium]